MSNLVFPKAFTELRLVLSDVLKVAPFTFYQEYEFFSVARSGKIWSAYHLNGIFGKGLVKKYRGGGPEHFEMWLENT